MIADIFYPIFTLTITVLARFTLKKLFRGFVPMPSTSYRSGPPDPQLQLFLALPKTDVPIFFLYYLLTKGSSKLLRHQKHN